MNTLWLAVFYYANPLFLTGMPFLVDAFLIHASFLGVQLVRKTRAGYVFQFSLQLVH